MEFTSCLSTAVLSRYNLINATIHRQISGGYVLTLLAAGEILDVKCLITFIYKNTPWIVEVHAISE